MKRQHRAFLAGLSARVCVCVCAGAGVGHAFAATHDPADASAPVPPAIYQSPFADYRVLGEDKNTPWRDANATVGKIGGWRVYAREAADAAKARDAANAMKAREAAGGIKANPAVPPTPPPAAPPASPHKHGG